MQKSAHMNRRLTEISSEIADILENLDEDDKNSTDAVSEDGDSFVATELKKAVKSIGKTPDSILTVPL